MIISRAASGVRITDSSLRSTRSGAKGAAIRAVGRPAGLRNILVQGNRLSGGGFYVADLLGRGYRDVVVTENLIVADNPGVRGIDRVSDVTFTGDYCTIGAQAGRAGAVIVNLLARDMARTDTGASQASVCGHLPGRNGGGPGAVP